MTEFQRQSGFPSYKLVASASTAKTEKGLHTTKKDENTHTSTAGSNDKKNYDEYEQKSPST